VQTVDPLDPPNVKVGWLTRELENETTRGEERVRTGVRRAWKSSTIEEKKKTRKTDWYVRPVRAEREQRARERLLRNCFATTATFASKERIEVAKRTHQVPP